MFGIFLREFDLTWDCWLKGLANAEGLDGLKEVLPCECHQIAAIFRVCRFGDTRDVVTAIGRDQS